VYYLNKFFIGVDLAKLIVKAIVLMEDSGGQIMGITSDGATTNCSMWNSLGVNTFKHKFDTNIFVIIIFYNML